ncbi:MAG: dimethylarginine dimethylaminohydrolase [Rhodospirillaceae bacterium]|nr:dimethylarginine dimethylaminohydrolase [Rhodospirillaceae bacterium]
MHFEFNRAIVRRPSSDVSRGLRSIDTGDPEFFAVSTEHDGYISALESAGLKVDILPALRGFPDAMFVEDPALVFTDIAIILRSLIEERAAEADSLIPILRSSFANIQQLKVGFVDGGDVLQLPGVTLIGISERTTLDGAQALISCLNQNQKSGIICKVPDGVLHLKSDCALLDEETILITERLANQPVFSNFKKIVVPREENLSANAIRVNSQVLMGREYPKTLEMVMALGFNVVPLATSEIRKIDAGLSCMSLRWLD